ncbi:MAG TPA: YggT family protein [Acidimicrobiales bacterium]|jgi:YggT family protein|nr:YggT family protein [Acidimicrobiales bacterium]
MATIVCLIIQLYLLVIFVRIIMSWFPPTPGTTYAQIFEVFDRVTDPVLAPVRAMLPPVRMGAMGLDLSPIVVFLIGTLLLRVIC